MFTSQLNNTILSSPSAKLKYRDRIVIKVIEKEMQNIVPKKIKLEVIFEDKDILIINKPKGMVVHPGAGNFENTLVNALKYKYQNNLYPNDTQIH